MLFDNVNKCLKGPESLIFDEACIHIVNFLQTTVSIFGQYDECHKCDFQNLTTLASLSNTSIVVNTRSSIALYYKKEGNETVRCRFKNLLYEHYRYQWNITEECSKIYIKEPADNAYLPILMAFVVLFCFGTIWYMVKCIYKNSGRLRQFLVWNSEIEEDLGGSSPGTPLVIERAPSVRKHPHRIKSIDIFRGLAIILMIFVNYGGGQYWFFQHSVWNGITIADLVFPWFLWLMGLSLTVSFQSRLRRAVPRRQMVFHVIRRSFILILFGVILNSNKNMSTIADLRFPGVLQRIGVTYLVVGILEVIFTKRLEADHVSVIHDFAVAWPQWLFVTCIVIIHTCVTFLVDVPGCGRGYLGPGGLDDHGYYYNCTGGVAGYIDRQVFGNHMYKNAPCHKLYETKVYYDPEDQNFFLELCKKYDELYRNGFISAVDSDREESNSEIDHDENQANIVQPLFGQVEIKAEDEQYLIPLIEARPLLWDFRIPLKNRGKEIIRTLWEEIINELGGILGTLTSILTVYFGVQAGRTLNTYQNVKAKVARWVIWGVITGLLGGALCSFSRDNGPIPINKQLWSLSFVLVTSGMAFIIQAFLFLVVDILRKWGGRPFFYPGMNAIILYVGHELMKNTFPFAWKPTDKTHGTYLFMNLWGTFLWVSISIFLYKRNLFLTI